MVWEFPPVNWMGKSTWSLSSQAIGLMAHCMQEEDKASFVPEVVGFFIGYWKWSDTCSVVLVYLQDLQHSHLGCSNTFKIFRLFCNDCLYFLPLFSFVKCMEMTGISRLWKAMDNTQTFNTAEGQFLGIFYIV